MVAEATNYFPCCYREIGGIEDEQSDKFSGYASQIGDFRALYKRIFRTSSAVPLLHTSSSAGLWKYHVRLVRPGPISFRTSWKFLFTCPWKKLLNTVCNSVFHILINYYQLTSCIENNVDTDQLTSSEAS